MLAYTSPIQDPNLRPLRALIWKRRNKCQTWVTPYGIFETKDDYIIISGATAEQWKGVCKVINREDLYEDNRFENPEKRLKNRGVLERIIENELKERSTEEWFRKFEEAGVPVAKVRDIPELFENPHILDRGTIKEVKIDSDTEFKVPGHGATFSEYSLEIKTPPPKLGEHTVMSIHCVLADFLYLKTNF